VGGAVPPPQKFDVLGVVCRTTKSFSSSTLVRKNPSFETDHEQPGIDGTITSAELGSAPVPSTAGATGSRCHTLRALPAAESLRRRFGMGTPGV